MSKFNKIYLKPSMYEDFCKSLDDGETAPQKFRTCKATVSTTIDAEFTFLRSYGTIVCIIDNITGEALDILRTECGYTSTSAQHIFKFIHDNPVTKLYRTDFDSKGMYYQRIY